MSQGNVELVRSTFDAITRRDYRGAALGLHQDAVWHNTAEFPGPTSCIGPQEIVDFWAGLMARFDENATASGIERVIEGDDTVVLGIRSVGRGEASGVPIDIRWAAVCRVSDGKISQVDIHGSLPKALKTVGLEG